LIIGRNCILSTGFKAAWAAFWAAIWAERCSQGDYLKKEKNTAVVSLIFATNSLSVALVTF